MDSLLQVWARWLFYLMHKNQRRESRKMKKQRNMFHRKEQDKTSEKDFNETKISNLPDKEFKITVIKILTVFGRRMNEYSQNFNKGKI